MVSLLFHVSLSFRYTQKITNTIDGDDDDEDDDDGNNDNDDDDDFIKGMHITGDHI